MDANQTGAPVGGASTGTSSPAPSAPTPNAASSPTPSAAPAPAATPETTGASTGSRDEHGRFTAKPIPPKQRTYIGMDDIPDEHFLTDSEKAAKRAGAQVARQVEGQAQEQAPAAPQKFTFAGEQWDTPAAAEQNFRTLRGLHRSQQQQIAQQQQVAQQYQNAHQQALARIAALEASLNPKGQGAAPNPESTTPPAGQKATGAKAFYERLGIDLNVYEQIAQTHGDRAATAWLNSEVAEKQGAALESKFQELIKPFAEQQEFMGRVSSVTNTFNNIAGYRIGDQYAYPELHDPQAAAYIGQIWKGLPVSSEKRHSPEALVMAVVMYREFARQHQAQISAASPTNPQPAAPQDAAGAAAAAARVASAVVGGNGGYRGTDAVSGNNPPAVRPSQPSAGGFDFDQFRRGIDQAGTANPSLGFAR